MQKGDIRYRVDYSPAAMFGTPDEANDGMLSREFESFEAAATFACEKAPTDFFGVTSVRREVCVSAKYGWWDEHGTWRAEAPCVAADLDINAPDLAI